MDICHSRLCFFGLSIEKLKQAKDYLSCYAFTIHKGYNLAMNSLLSPMNEFELIYHSKNFQTPHFDPLYFIRKTGRQKVKMVLKVGVSKYLS